MFWFSNSCSAFVCKLSSTMSEVESDDCVSTTRPNARVSPMSLMSARDLLEEHDVIGKQLERPVDVRPLDMDGIVS